MFRELRFGLLLAAAAVASAAFASAGAKAVPQESTRCYTIMGTAPVVCSTSWSTHYTPCSTTSTVRSISTVTPAAVTLTNTVHFTQVVTNATRSLVKTSSVIILSTQSSIATTTVTAISTTTSAIVSTETVPAPTNFNPVQITLPSSDFEESCLGNSSSQTKRSLASRDFGRGLDHGRQLLESPFTHPQHVDCYRWKPKAACSVVSVTIKTTVTAPTPTKTVTISKTTTVADVPSATTTVVVTQTSVTSTVTTTTVTNTATTTLAIATSTATFYPACESDNIVNNYFEGCIQFLQGDPSSLTSVSSNATTPYDCCVAAITLPSQLAAFYSFGPNGGPCTIYAAPSTSQCTTGQNSNVVYSNGVTYSGDYAGFTVGNAQCGSIQPDEGYM